MRAGPGRPPAGYLVKKRTRLRSTFRGSVRRRWSPWALVARFDTFEPARALAENDWQETGGRAEFAVFHKGRRVQNGGGA